VAIPIINNWRKYYETLHEGLGSSYERIILNRLILSLYSQNQYESALETPCFGFTGISGINLVALAKAGCRVMLEDHSAERAALIRKSWTQMQLPLQLRIASDYSRLDYPDKSIDFGFNFSALWFVNDLPCFLKELCRVIRKEILICVPNRDGIGYKGQLKGYSPEEYPDLRPEHIDPKSIIHLMKKQGWNLEKSDYIDCPPWPDIGMSKEEYIARFRGRPEISLPERDDARDPRSKNVSILPYYRGEDPAFARRMMRFYPFEMLAPRVFKKYWAHHYYLLFRP